MRECVKSGYGPLQVVWLMGLTVARCCSEMRDCCGVECLVLGDVFYGAETDCVVSKRARAEARSLCVVLLICGTERGGGVYDCMGNERDGL